MGMGIRSPGLVFLIFASVFIAFAVMKETSWAAEDPSQKRGLGVDGSTEVPEWWHLKTPSGSKAVLRSASGGNLELVLQYTISSSSSKIRVTTAIARDWSGYKALDIELSGSGDEDIAVELLDNDNERWICALPAGRSVSPIPFEDFNLARGKGNGLLDRGNIMELSLELTRSRVGSGELGIRRIMPVDSLGLLGPAVSVDIFFERYFERPWDETAKEIRDKGFTCVHLIVLEDLPEWERLAVDAFHKQGLAVVLQVFPTTDPEAYRNHPEWHQKMLNGGSKFDWRVYLDPIYQGYTDYIAQKCCDRVKSMGYDAIELAEPWFEVWGGPYPSNPNSGHYASISAGMRQAFLEKYGVDPADLFDEESTHYFMKDRDLYQKWVDFRVEVLIRFMTQIFSRVKEAKPGIVTMVMYLSDIRVAYDKVREYQGQDLEAILEEVRPDVIVIQSAWQDWLRPNLRPDYVLEYGKAYVPRVRGKARIIVQTDIGSSPQMRRDYNWMRGLSALAQQVGFGSYVAYEYSLGDF